MSDMRIAKGFALPSDAVTQTFAILARKGAGKTYTGAVLTEELVKAGLQVVVLDPLGAWWGLRAAANGKDAGLPVTILGGEHGDIPLETTAGKVVADLVIDNPASIVLDLSDFESNAAQDRFVTDFAERLYRAKAKDRRPLHLMVDEADSFAPQRPMPGQQRMLGAFESIVRRGRIRGLGVTLITQRPAVLNKNVLTQTECLVTLQMTAPQDRAAIDEWVRGNGTKEERDELVGSLASLHVGEAWFWSPSWLRTFRKVQVRRRETFDSSRTPEAGEKPIEPRQLADVDLEALRERMAATIEKAEQSDPKRLQQRIRILEREVAQRPAETKVETVVERVEVPVIDPKVAERLDLLRADATKLTDLGLEIAHRAETLLNEMSVAVRNRPASVPASPRRTQETYKVRAEVQRTLSDDAPQLKAGARRILETLARHHPMRVTKAQLGTLAKFKITGGTFLTYWSTLKRYGLVEDQGGLIGLTDAGSALVGHVPQDPLSTEELLDQWRGALKAGARQMLDVLVAVYPNALPRDDLAERVEMTATGGTFNTYLGTLRRNGLIDVESGMVRANDALFLSE